MLFAYHEIGYLCLDHLLKSGDNVVALFTHAPNPKENIWFKTPDVLAKKYNIPVYYDADLNSPEVKKLILEKLCPDVVFSLSFRQKIPNFIINYPKLGAFNMHGAYLPKYRGCVPLNWALVKGEKSTGVTIHYLADKFDTGAIVAQHKIPITKSDDINSLYRKFHRVGLELFKKTWPKIKSSKIKTIPQDPAQASYFGKRKPEDGLINWQTMSSEEIYNLIRAVTKPYPGAFTILDGKKIILWHAKIRNKNPKNLKPGEHFEQNGLLFIGCSDGKVLECDDYYGASIIANIVS